MRILPALFATAAAFVGTAAPAAAQQPGVPAPEQAQAQGQTGSTVRQPTVADVRDNRVKQLVIFEGDTCPQSRDPNEVTICVTAPAGQRFRIPPNLREDPNALAGQSWTNQALALSYVGATGIGSCSTVGPGGFTGCAQQLINRAVAERRGRPEVNWARLIEQARQERLGQIGQQSAAAEQDADDNRRVQELHIREGETCPPSTQAVIITCTFPDGRPAPQQTPGEPQLPVGSAASRTPVPGPTPQSQPQD
jgi:hypothetical protein